MATFEEFLTYRPPPGFRDELIHGEIVLSPSASRKHADICFALSQLISRVIRPDYIVRLDTTHRLGEREGPRPDVFVIGRKRWVAAGDGYPEGSPELAIEVLSSSNTGQEMRTKRDLYLSDPRCRAVWEVDREAETITCYRNGPVVLTTVLDRSKAIYLPHPLAASRLKVSKIFDGIISA